MYDQRGIESKWQRFWEKAKIFKKSGDCTKKKYYVLGAWAYPSGDIHMGHVRNYTVTDVVARYMRMKGFNVLNPVGWDAFGLPTENAALKKNLDPFTWNKMCTEKMGKQLRSLGIGYDWDEAIDTSHPGYYKWTQWLLIRFFEKGLLYKAKRPVNWCVSCQTVLANEQVLDGHCERCKSEVAEKELDQWFLRVTAYADRLLEDFKYLKEWPEHVLKMQEHWIGKNADGTFKIKDWCISRQRYWGAPIPFVTCPHCGVVPVSDDDLPILLPRGVDFSPGSPEPLARDRFFVETVCPKCGGSAERATEVLDTFVFSSYYFLRFVDPRNSREVFAKDAEKYWMPVDFYLSGVELANNHLIYARFFHKAMFDMGMVSEPEPFKRFYAQGMILKDGEKMSKSRGNVVSPVEIVDQFGADTLRTFILFLGPLEADVVWGENGVKGCYRFLQKVERVVSYAASIFNKDWRKKIGTENLDDSDLKLRSSVYDVISMTGEAAEKTYRFNTAISSFMGVFTDLEFRLAKANTCVISEAAELLTVALSLFAPHLAEELWEKLGKDPSVCQQPWPVRPDFSAGVEQVNVVIQVNGKKKGVLRLKQDEAADESVVVAMAIKQVGKSKDEIRKAIFVPCRIVNLVI